MEIINPWMLYLWTRLDGVVTLFMMLLFILVCGTVLFIIGYGNDVWGERPKFMAKWSSILCGTALFLSLLILAIPSQKDMAMIYVVPKLANSIILQQEAGAIYKMAKSALQEYLPETEEVKTK